SLDSSCSQTELRAERAEPDRGSADRMRTGGGGGEDPLGAELPHPCELTIQVAPELSVTFALYGEMILERAANAQRDAVPDRHTEIKRHPDNLVLPRTRTFDRRQRRRRLNHV